MFTSCELNAIVLLTVLTIHKPLVTRDGRRDTSNPIRSQQRPAHLTVLHLNHHIITRKADRLTTISSSNFR
jgi:hypothetical protein